MSYLKIGKYYGESLTATTYQIKEVLDADYLDITNVEHWFMLQDELNKDYLYCRDGAIGYINYGAGGFNALTQKGKELAAKNFCVAKADRDTIYTDTEQESFWNDFVINSKNVRVGRWDKAKSYASYRLAIVDSNDLAEETLLLNQKYTEYGIESFAKDGKLGLLDWINDTYSYSGGTGFSSKSYYTDTIKNGIIDRLNGLY